jgi:hypothetical protein
VRKLAAGSHLWESTSYASISKETVGQKHPKWAKGATNLAALYADTRQFDKGRTVASEGDSKFRHLIPI